jgi:hypothetical protein
MSQPMEKQAGGRYEEEAVPTQWTFSIEIVTGPNLDKTHYRIIAGAATLNLTQNPGGGYTGSIQFNSPNMAADPNATQLQKNWATIPLPITPPNISYDPVAGILSFTVPGAPFAFGPNFNAFSGAPTPPAPAGPPCGPFQFAGYWDGVSNTITGGCCWVPIGYLLDAGGTPGVGAPPSLTCPPQPGSASAGGPEGEGGGDDPPMGSWTGGDGS